MTLAAIDRLVHHATIIESYRRRWVERMKADGTKFPGGRKAGVR